MNAIFITVRTGSKRLPEKALLKVGDKRTIELVIDRAKKSKKAEIIVLCTTRLSADNVLCDIALENGIKFFRGSTEDKLMRWKKAAAKYDVDFFVTFDGDDLLCAPELADLAFEQYERTGAHFIEAPNVPCGAFTYGISVWALNRVCAMKGTTDTEMMVPYFKTGLFKTEELQNVPIVLQRPEIRMTLDYEDDLKFFRNVYDHFINFRLQDVIEYLDANPEVPRINAYLQQVYLDNQKRLTKAVLNESV